MVKKVLLSLTAALAIGSVARAQHVCGTDEVHKEILRLRPEAAAYEAQLEADIQNQLRYINFSRLARTTGTTGLLDEKYIIPVVVHIIHDYGVEYISDDRVYEMIKNTNTLYQKTNPDTNQVISTYKGNIPGTTNRYIGKSNIEFRLARRDPQGNPTHGITRRRSALANNGGDQAKFDVWPPDAYINIWLVQKFNSAHSSAGAYAYQPSTGGSIPYYDGIIGLAGQTSGSGFTLGHELGHVLSLAHPWGNTNEPEVDCSGSDAVDDTPPTKGHSQNNGSFNCGPNAPALPNILRTVWDTFCTQQGATVGRDNITAPLTVNAVADNSTTDGITLRAYTRTVLKSVRIYPDTGTLGQQFTIQITQNGNPVPGLSPVTEVVTIANDTSFQTVGVNWVLMPSAVPYKITFSQNPGMRRGPSGGALVAVGGTIAITALDSTNNRFPFFYHLDIQHGYFKVYDKTQLLALYDNPDTINTKIGDNSYLIDYPDTVNVQNVMDYSFCDFMFTHGQALRMRAALNSEVGGRKNLWSTSNLSFTGVMQPFADLPPIADFSVNRPFLCANVATSSTLFTNRSWNDTVTSVSWTFSNDATNPTSTSLSTVNNGFLTPGWVTASLTANSNAGSNTVSKENVAYAADPNPTAENYGAIEEFSGDLSRFPIMNYFNTEHKWEIVNVGYYDSKCIRFTNYDTRDDISTGVTEPAQYTNAPDGVYADFYTTAYNFSGLGATPLNMNFMSASATRASVTADMRDVLLIQYSTDCGANWVKLDSLSGSRLANNGTLGIPFAPLYMGDWRANAINIPEGHPARSARTFFRFRYIATTDNGNDIFRRGSGNHFYMDRLRFTNNPLGIDEQILTNKGMIIAPNPTHGGTTIILKNGEGVARVQVTDMTGKVVYQTEQRLSSNASEILIPADRIAARGMYMVHVINGGQSLNEKLVVY